MLLMLEWIVLLGLTAAATQRPTVHSGRAAVSSGKAARSSETRGNVLLITVDTLRADHLGCYGYKEVQTPTIDALAHDGILFPLAISQVPLTLPEHVAILTGTYPFHNQVQDFTAPPLGEKFRTLAVPFMQGELALRQKQAPQATRYFQECLQLAPDFDQAMSGLAGALEAQGKPQDAIQWLQKAIQRNPRNFRAWYEIGWIQERSGDHAAATQYLQKALAIQPSFAPAWRDLGMLQYGNQQYATAAASLSKAIALGLNQPTLFNFLGICYSRTNRMPEALRSYQQALKLTPDYAEAHLNLGFAYEQLHQQQATTREYAEACRLSERACQLIRWRQP